MSALNRQLNHQMEPSPSLRGPQHEPERFEEFWALYGKVGPRKVAAAGWDKALKNGATADEVIDGLERWVIYWRTPGAAKVKWPQGWFTDERWKDAPPPLLATCQPNLSKGMQAAQAYAARRGL